VLIAMVLFVGSLARAAAPASTASKSAAHKTTSKTSSASKKQRASRHAKRGKRSASWRRGQQKMDAARAREIQEALIREHYLDGEPTGVWDQKSQNAMVKFQAANGWQSKTVPDSRALIKLGLGPNHDHLLNPDSAMTSPIEAPSATAHPSPGPNSVTSDPVSTSGQPQN
jgi:peptidoglycan hydrolase-like protein with peptidoglycan-binding domain